MVEVKWVRNGVCTDFTFVPYANPPEYGVQHVGINITSLILFTASPEMKGRAISSRTSRIVGTEAQIPPLQRTDVVLRSR